MSAIAPVWFPAYAPFKSILETPRLAESARVYHTNDQCGSVKYPQVASVPYYEELGLIHCHLCQSLAEQNL